MAKLNAKKRKKIPKEDFALPKERKYPIEDKNHARDALAYSSGKPEEGEVRRKVEKKYPEMGKDKKTAKKAEKKPKAKK